jgi:hypothetical protein
MSRGRNRSRSARAATGNGAGQTSSSAGRAGSNERASLARRDCEASFFIGRDPSQTSEAIDDTRCVETERPTTPQRALTARFATPGGLAC